MQSSRPPDRFIEGLESDVYHLLWSKDHDFEVDAIGSTTKHRPYIKHTAVYNKRKNFGVGLLDLKNHARALRVKWALNYLDASDGQWKLILDVWLWSRSAKGVYLGSVWMMDDGGPTENSRPRRRVRRRGPGSGSARRARREGLPAGAAALHSRRERRLAGAGPLPRRNSTGATGTEARAPLST
eukprot:scaffold25253_cov118-Isochrysis_galbana.AAC.3